MNTLHLISDDRMKHSVHIDCSNTGACDTAIEHLKSEATGTDNTIIICDKNNMPLTYMDFAVSPTKPTVVDLVIDIDDGVVLFALAVVLLVAYMVFI